MRGAAAYLFSNAATLLRGRYSLLLEIVNSSGPVRGDPPIIRSVGRFKNLIERDGIPINAPYAKSRTQCLAGTSCFGELDRKDQMLKQQARKLKQLFRLSIALQFFHPNTQRTSTV